MALYGEPRVGELTRRVATVIERHVRPAHPAPGPLSEQDVILIAYGDQVTQESESPLATLKGLLLAQLGGLISGVHILPFFPYSSDDGFSVIDYRQVDPNLGTWDDVGQIAASSRLMVDAVINHISSRSEWFQAYLRGDAAYQDTFIAVDPNQDLSAVVRPRDLPLLTRFETALGPRHLWTTFSEDQIDLNFANPEVMLEILDLLLFYVRNGAQIIRLDAIAFLWKQISTPSIHLPQAHHAVKLMRAVLDVAAPGVLLITETNVPHSENVSYFGDGGDEADLVYQFPLPPLVLHSLISGDASRLSAWARDLSLPSNRVTFFNFLASHDGIGVRPAVGILSEDEIEALAEIPERSGGQVSYRARRDGGRSPYELNVTYLDALSNPEEFTTAPQRAVDRFLAAHAIMLAMPGLPAIYFHSLFGSRNDLARVQRSGRARSINRQKLRLELLTKELANRDGLRHQIFSGFSKLLRARRSNEAFSPSSSHRILDLGPSAFGVTRDSQSGSSVHCLHEVAGAGSEYRLDEGVAARDLLTNNQVDLGRVRLGPYQVRWLAVE